MFDFFSGPHILILLVVMLVVVGPKDLPRLMHMLGQWAGKARAMASEFKKSFDDMARQEDLDKLRRELDELRQSNLAVSELSQKVAEADLPPEAEPRSGEFQINVTPADAFPEGTGPQAPASQVAVPHGAVPQSAEPEPATAVDGAHRP
jgi:sec-independent protein translocase protein TatB